MLGHLSHDPKHTLHDFYAAFPELVSYCLSSTTPRQVIERYLAFRPVVGSCDTILCENNGSETRLRYCDEFVHQESSYSAIANFLNLYLMMKAIHNDIKPEVHLSGNLKSYESLASQSFDTKIQWQSTHNEIVFNNLQLDTTYSSDNSNLVAMQYHALTKISDTIDTKSNFSSLIEELITYRIEQNAAHSESNLLNEICDEVNISRWTLYRKLTHEQTSFSNILKKVRLDMSLHFLLDSQRSVQEISDMVGFGSSSAFSRFFYMNMGVAPLGYRKAKSQI